MSRTLRHKERQAQLEEARQQTQNNGSMADGGAANNGYEDGFNGANGSEVKGDPLNIGVNLDECHEDEACCRVLSEELMGWVTSLSFTRQLGSAQNDSMNDLASLYNQHRDQRSLSHQDSAAAKCGGLEPLSEVRDDEGLSEATNGTARASNSGLGRITVAKDELYCCRRSLIILYAETFCSGDVRAATGDLSVGLGGTESFESGLNLGVRGGIVLSLVVWLLWDVIIDPAEGYNLW